MFLTSLVHVFCMPLGAEANATVITALYRRCDIPWMMSLSCFVPLLLPLKVLALKPEIIVLLESHLTGY